ncbi:MAG: nitrophenyl compound nitroreductase subunit ArsF family protein [Candidatus Omnitrophota bacterium]|jgi:hypothetical protein
MQKILLVFISIVFFSIRGIVAINFVYAQERPASNVSAYYFHGSSRCPNCYKLEKYSREAIETCFKEALLNGKLEFRVINVEDKGSRYYVEHYQLYTKTLILSLEENGKEVKWKNLNAIWKYIDDNQGFIDYIKGEVVDYLKEVQ